MAERVDVLIAGTGFGGSIAAWRLAELYRAAGADPKAIVVLERGRRFKHTDFKQSMHIEHLSERLPADPGPGRAGRRRPTRVGGGSNLYLAASLRSPRETFERRDRQPGDGPERRMWPAAISRRDARPATTRAPSAACACKRPTWNQVSKSGGLWAATLRRRRPHLRPRAAGHQPRALRRRQVVPHGLRLRRQELADHQLPRRSAERAGRAGRARASRSSRCASRGAPVPLRRHRSTDGHRDPPADRRESRSSARCSSWPPARWATRRSSCARGNDLPSLSRAASAATSASTATTSPRSSTTRSGCATVLGLPGYARLPQGQADHDDDLRLLGRPARPPLRRHALHPPGDLPLVADQLPLRRRPRPRRRPVVVGPAEEAGDRQLGQPDRAAGDGRGHPRRRRSTPSPPQGGAVRPNAGPGRGRHCSTTRSPSSRSACARRPTRR